MRAMGHFAVNYVHRPYGQILFGVDAVTAPVLTVDCGEAHGAHRLVWRGLQSAAVRWSAGRAMRSIRACRPMVVDIVNQGVQIRQALQCMCEQCLG